MYIGIKEVRMKKPTVVINQKRILVFTDLIMISQFNDFIIDSIPYKIQMLKWNIKRDGKRIFHEVRIYMTKKRVI